MTLPAVAGPRLLHVAAAPEDSVNADGHVVAYADQEMARREREAAEVRFGDPVKEIVLEADGFGADLIVFVSWGERDLGGLVPDGTADRVTRRTETAVLVLRPGPNAYA